MLADFHGVNSATMVSFSQAVHTLSLSTGLVGIAVPSTLPAGSQLQHMPRSADELRGTEIQGQGYFLTGCFRWQTELRWWFVLRPYSSVRSVPSWGQEAGAEAAEVTSQPSTRITNPRQGHPAGWSPGIVPGTASASMAHGRSSSPRNNIVSPSFPV